MASKVSQALALAAFFFFDTEATIPEADLLGW